MREMKDSGVEWIGEIPKEWKLSKTKHFYDCYDGKRVPIDAAKRKSGIYPYWGAGSITDYVDDYLFDEELVLVGEDGAPFFDYTRPVSFLINEKVWVNNHIHVLKVHKDTVPAFMVYYFNTVDYGSYINGSILNKLTQGNMNNIAFVVPPYAEQVRIVNYLDFKCAKIDSIIEKQQAIIEKLKEYKLSIITEAVTKGLNPDTEMKDSGYEYIGSIPSDWEVCRLRNIGNPQNGLSKGGEFFGEGYPFVSYGDIYRNYSLPENVSGLVRSSGEERENYSVQEGDIFFTRTSETIEEVGFSCVCEKTIPDATFAGFAIRVRPFNDKLLTRFAKFYFRSEHHRTYFAKEMNLVTRASLSQDLLKSMPVLIPSKKEQAEIAEFLDYKCNAIAKSIDAKQKLIENLRSYKKSLIYEVVTGKKEV